MKPQNYRVLLNELISVSSTDTYISPIPKWEAHLNTYLTHPSSHPHRAFSIFLFNSQNELLFQRRSQQKKTFPLCWTNTCCSHPNMVEWGDTGRKGEERVRDSLHRALDRELKMNLTKQKFYFVDKILYKAPGSEQQQFGEYEVDYVYLCKVKTKQIPFTMVPEQVCQTQWVSKQNLKTFVQKKQNLEKCSFSPWFMKMFHNGLLDKWWEMVMKGEMRDVGVDDDKFPVTSL